MHVIDNKTCRKLLLWYEMVENITLANLNKNYVIRIQIHIFQF